MILVFFFTSTLYFFELFKSETLYFILLTCIPLVIFPTSMVFILISLKIATLFAILQLLGIPWLFDNEESILVSVPSDLLFVRINNFD